MKWRILLFGTRELNLKTIIKLIHPVTFLFLGVSVVFIQTKMGLVIYGIMLFFMMLNVIRDELKESWRLANEN